jgi:hypothetical protein
MAASLCTAGLSSMVFDKGSAAAGNAGILCVVAYMFAFGASWGYVSTHTHTHTHTRTARVHCEEPSLAVSKACARKILFPELF